MGNGETTQSESGPTDPCTALYAVLMFHCTPPGAWTPQARAEWKEITGSDEATTKVLCDHVRKTLADRTATDTIEEVQAQGIEIMRQMLDRQADIIEGLAMALDGILERLPESLRSEPNVIRARAVCKKAIEAAAKHKRARGESDDGKEWDDVMNRANGRSST